MHQKSELSLAVAKYILRRPKTCTPATYNFGQDITVGSKYAYKRTMYGVLLPIYVYMFIHSRYIPK